MVGDILKYLDHQSLRQVDSHTYDVTVAAQQVEAIEERLDSRKNQWRGNDRKVIRRNQGQWSNQDTLNRRSSNSNDSSRSGKESPYRGYFSCGQLGHRKKECLNRLQKSLLSYGGLEKS
ncbi:hypothetical protein PanWU01x14_178630 [Parasponia andersonii]|uniref:Zinc finger, CCHC-type n=1 Tax=Parasponia andersonii TaxID=3476 RepID=A0A2P5C6X3_PARAD|nr:hypothetical protein PanWU01x14_178630 [Parasponia andersonii]